MKKFTFAAIAALAAIAISTAKAADAREYNTKAALFGRHNEVTIGVLADQPGATLQRAVAPKPVDLNNYNRRKALFGARAELMIGVLADMPAAGLMAGRPFAALRAISVDTYNTKKALI